MVRALSLVGAPRDPLNLVGVPLLPLVMQLLGCPIGLHLQRHRLCRRWSPPAPLSSSATRSRVVSIPPLVALVVVGLRQTGRVTL